MQQGGRIDLKKQQAEWYAFDIREDRDMIRGAAELVGMSAKVRTLLELGDSQFASLAAKKRGEWHQNEAEREAIKKTGEADRKRRRRPSASAQ